MNQLNRALMKTVSLIIMFSAMFGCKTTSYQVQSTSCFETYAADLAECKRDACRQAAVDDYLNCIGYDLVFPLHFVVLTDSIANTNAEVRKELKAVVDTLNRYFTVESSRYPPDNRKRIVSFTYKSATLYDEAIKIGGPLVNFATQYYFNFDRRHEFKSLVNRAKKSELRNDSAINVYIVDSYNTVDGLYQDVISSSGNNNDGRPYIMLDYARINGKAKRSAAEEHEMGHAFGLAHVCVPGAKNNTSTNIMASKGSYPADNSCEYDSDAPELNCADKKTTNGRGGKRDIGFNNEQCRIIIDNAEEIRATLGL